MKQYSILKQECECELFQIPVFLNVSAHCSVATLVLILGKSPYKYQNRKNGPYLVLILDCSPYFEEMEEPTAIIKLLV